LRVHDVDGDDVICEIVNGGMLGENRQGLPGSGVRSQKQCRRDRSFLCPNRGRCSPGSQSCLSLRRGYLDHCKARKAAGHRAPRRNPHRR
jgi:hypothetical protein